MVVIITGASSGIGRALAQHYLGQGAIVAVVARRADRLASLATAETGGRLFAFPGDVTDRDAMAAIVADVERAVGPIDLAIASAGIGEEETAPDLDLALLQRIFATNVCGVFNVLVPVVAAMRQRGRGQVVAISSLAAEHALPRMTAYCMSKAALNIGMQGLYLMAQGTGLGVTTICPGFIATDMSVGRVSPRRCVPLERATARIVRAIERGQRMCYFPVGQYVLVRLLRWVPLPVRRIVLEPVFNVLFVERTPAVGKSA
jgi:hypothetical protein